MDTYKLIEWPEVQELMDYEGFREHACLANDEYFVDTYGSSAYFVEENWLKGIESNCIKFTDKENSSIDDLREEVSSYLSSLLGIERDGDTLKTDGITISAKDFGSIITHFVEWGKHQMFPNKEEVVYSAFNWLDDHLYDYDLSELGQKNRLLEDFENTLLNK